MSDMMQTGFDYGALPVEVGISGRIIGERLRTRLKRTVQDIIESGKDLISIKPNLEGCFDAWFEHETGLDRQMAYKFIAAADRFGDGAYNNYTALSPTVIYLLSAPSTPESVIDRAIEQAEAGDKVTVADVKQWKEAAQAASQRAEEFRQESNARRKKIRELEQQVDLLKAEKPEPEIIEKIIEKPVIPPEFANLEDALKSKRAELESLSRNTQDAIQKNKTVYESRERLKQEVEDLTALLSRHKAAEREQVEHKRLTDSVMQFTALFLAEIQALEHAPSIEQRRRWDQAIRQLMDSASASRNIVDALDSMPLEGVLIDQAA